MVRIPESRLEYFMAEDVPYLDLTSEVLGIGDVRGRMEYFTREDCVLCGTAIVERMARDLDLQVAEARPDGAQLAAGEAFLTVEGPASALHQLWKAGLNVFDHLSAVATKTHGMVASVHRENPACEVLTTRKSMPGVKDLLTYAVRTGGAYPHRLGLSETVLVFDNHLEFFGGFDAFVAELPRIRRRCVEKKLFVECSPDQARVLARAGVDGVQLDKVPVSALHAVVEELRGIDDRLTIIAAGGINPQNAAAYAATGIDGIATTALFTAKPLDMSVHMKRLE